MLCNQICRAGLLFRISFQNPNSSSLKSQMHHRFQENIITILARSHSGTGCYRLRFSALGVYGLCWATFGVLSNWVLIPPESSSYLAAGQRNTSSGYEIESNLQFDACSHKFTSMQSPYSLRKLVIIIAPATIFLRTKAVIHHNRNQR